MESKRPKRRQILIRVSSETYDRLQQIAQDERRSVSAQADFLLEKALVAGACPAPPPATPAP